MALPIYVPLLYISILVGSLLLFSRWHRNSKQAAILTTEPWFPTHRSRDLYISLLSHQQSPPETTPPQPLVDDKLLMSALLLRAAEDVRRIHRLRVSKQALATLIQSGSLNEDVQARLGAAEKEMEAEVVDVVSEANSYRPGWGGWIFSSASEMVGRDKIKEILGNMDRVRIEEERKYKLINPSWQSSITAMPVNPAQQQRIQQQQQAQQQLQQLQQSQQLQQLLQQQQSANNTPSSLPPSTPRKLSSAKISGTSTPTGTGVASAVENLASQAGEALGEAVEQAEDLVSSGVSTPVKTGPGSTKGTPVGSAKKKGKRR